MSGQHGGQATTRQSGLFGYCLVTGVLAGAAGAGASLLGGSLWMRLVMWLAVLLGGCAAAGWWWARSPARARQWTVDLLVRPATRDVPSRRA